MNTGFEGSYLGKDDAISPQAIMECKICWTPYDPDEGDETRSILPGTPFLALPDDWKCPNCDGPKEQFMILEDPGAEAMEVAQTGEAFAADRAAALVAEFREVHSAKMRDVPFSNKSISVEAIGFQIWNGHVLGVLVTPWMMSLVLMEGPDDNWGVLTTGETTLEQFPSGAYEFIHAWREGLGSYKTCSLFSPMGEFASQLQATDTARAVMQHIFLEEVREETDKSADIRAQREAELDAQAEAEAAHEAHEAELAEIRENPPSRRAVITAGMGE